MRSVEQRKPKLGENLENGEEREKRATSIRK